MKTQVASLLLCFAFAPMVIPEVGAAVIFGTYNGNDSGGESQIDSTSGKGISFTMPGTLQPSGTTEYDLDSVQLLLRGATDSSNIKLALYTNDGSNTPGTQLTTFSAVPFTLTSTSTLYTFSADADVLLQAGTTYWVTFYGTNVGQSGSNAMLWESSSPLPSPASSVGVTLGTRVLSSELNASTPANWTNTASSLNNAFIVNATAVPEPGAWMLVTLGGLMVLLRRSSRQVVEN